jgi:hypothetical protein
MKARWRISVFGLLLVGAAGTAAALNAPGETRIAIERRVRAPGAPAPRHSGELCGGGMSSLASIEIIPDAIVRNAGREHAEYHAEIAVQRGTKVGIAWNVDLIDDRGNPVVAKLDAGSAKASAGNVALTSPMTLQLGDGYYSLRVRAAVTADDEPSDVVEAFQHIEVKGGQWAELDDHEWFERSRARQAFSAAELAARGQP